MKLTSSLLKHGKLAHHMPRHESILHRIACADCATSDAVYCEHKFHKTAASVLVPACLLLLTVRLIAEIAAARCLEQDAAVHGRPGVALLYGQIATGNSERRYRLELFAAYISHMPYYRHACSVFAS
jgi:hypothetical protein